MRLQLTESGWWRATGALAAVIAVGALIPVPVEPPSPPGFPLDKVVHLGEFLVFAWCLARAGAASRWPSSRRVQTAFAVSIAYGIMLELAQRLLPYRSAEVLDVVMNIAGTGLGVWLDRVIPWRDR